MLQLCDGADGSQLFSYAQESRVGVLIRQQTFRCQADLVSVLNFTSRFLLNNGQSHGTGQISISAGM